MEITIFPHESQVPRTSRPQRPSKRRSHNPTRERFDKFTQILPLSREHNLIRRVPRKERNRLVQRAQIN